MRDSVSPDPKISGGQVLSSRTRPTKNRAGLALRMSAQGLYRSQSYLGDYLRRMRARMGTPKAMTAAAHKLARIVYYMVTTQREYDATVFQEQERRTQDRQRAELYGQAKELGLQLVKAESVPWESPPPIHRPGSECVTVVLPVERFRANGEPGINRLCQPRGQPHKYPYCPKLWLPS
jgi:hypothetical protein